MSRYRLYPTSAQEAVLREHCAHARYMWNLAVEQHAHSRPGRAAAPGYLEQCRQLTAARKEHPWLAAGSQTVQQQALRDFAQAMTAYFDPGNPAGAPVLVLLDGEVPHVPGVHAVTPQHRFLSGCGEQPVTRHANTLSTKAGISGEVKRRFLPSLKAGVPTPQS